MATLLVVDDDPALLRALRVGLQASGHEVRTAATGADGLREVAEGAPDVVVLDLGLPDIDGLEVCRRIRSWTGVPVIVLSATGSEERKVAALDGGADDYVTKPFALGELQARVRAALRRAASRPGTASVGIGRLVVDRAARRALVGGVPIQLTPTEWSLLDELASEAGRVCPREQLLDAVWGPGDGEAARLHAYVHRLRRKLAGSAVAIRTAPGVGYSLVEAESE